MFFMLCVVFHLIINKNYASAQSCKSFNNVNMLLYDRIGQKFYQDINGCVTRTVFGNTTVVKAFTKDQIIPKLGKDSIRHMKYLTMVSFRNCNVEEIEQTAFRNVPSLATVEISFGKLRAVPKGVFNFDLTPQLEAVKLDHNRINFIEDESFFNISSLKNVQLNNNLLERWRSEWFQNSTALEVINLAFNNLKEIPSRAFTSFTSLKDIRLDHNDISKVQRDAFKGVRTLDYLGLSHNKLTSLSDSSFPNTLRINYFRINANYLTFLSNDVLKKLAAVEISMNYNPWTCPCLERINYWLYIKNGRIKSDDKCSRSHIPVCVVPNNTETCTDEFDREAMLKYVNIIKTINMSDPVSANCMTFK
ncbi:hypothetical protein NQ315_007159 [Exocentrus adspersus]|uniref:Uncharacterized protein n=1 Tax=Exocentrus adspersus TaxID=1586481 RepID=A0AAV8WDH0_9CUCU|nr:hypothetical protein NQ315_007159 [Exocentrus adspersus]